MLKIAKYLHGKLVDKIIINAQNLKLMMVEMWRGNDLISNDDAKTHDGPIPARKSRIRFNP